MTARLFLTIITTFFISTNSFAQTEDDNIEFLRVQNQINEGNYRKALDVLSNISPQGKASPFYLSYKATCYEKLEIYDSAAIAYRQLYDNTKSFDVMKKIAEMNDKHAEMKEKHNALVNCQYCLGRGEYKADILCPECGGTPCKEGWTCAACKGGGCSQCKNTGKRYACCPNNCSNGRVLKVFACKHSKPMTSGDQYFFIDKFNLLRTPLNLNQEHLRASPTSEIHQNKLSPLKITEALSSGNKVVIFWSSDNPESVKEYKKHMSNNELYKQLNYLFIPISLDDSQDKWITTITNEGLHSEWDFRYDNTTDIYGNKLGIISDLRTDKLYNICKQNGLPFGLVIENNIIVGYNDKVFDMRK